MMLMYLQLEKKMFASANRVSLRHFIFLHGEGVVAFKTRVRGALETFGEWQTIVKIYNCLLFVRGGWVEGSRCAPVCKTTPERNTN